MIGQRCYIRAEASPGIRRSGLAAAPMSARVESQAMTPRQARNHLIPDARVKTRGVTKENGRSFAGPLPQGDFDIVDEHLGLHRCARHAYFSLTAALAQQL